MFYGVTAVVKIWLGEGTKYTGLRKIVVHINAHQGTHFSVQKALRTVGFCFLG